MACIYHHSNSGLPSVTLMGMRRASSPTKREGYLAIGFALLVLLFAAGRLPAMPRAETHEMRHQIEHLEDTWRNAVLKGNITAMDALLAGTTTSPSVQLASCNPGSRRWPPSRSRLNMHFKSARTHRQKDPHAYGTTALVTSRAGSERHGSGWRSLRELPVHARICQGPARCVAHRKLRSQQDPGAGRSALAATAPRISDESPEDAPWPHPLK